jgi:hypothetical protein
VSILAKHATATNGPTLSASSKDRETLVKSNALNNSKGHNSETHRSRRRSQSQDREKSVRDKSDHRQTETNSTEEDYSITTQDTSATHNNNSPSNNAYAENPSNDCKPFSHLHLSESEPSKSPGDCASSSGNSSLTPSTSAPSLSPSASSSSAASCSCSTSDETTLLKSIVEVNPDSFTLAEYKSISTSEQRNSIVSPTPFFLHPPSSKEEDIGKVVDSQPSQIFDFETDDSNNNNSSAADKNTNNSTEIATASKKKSHHKRQPSTTVNSPFFLHPPENLVSETHQRVVSSKMAPAPVNPSHTLHHHFSDPINEPTPKLKVTLPGDASPTASSSSSPPLSPPGPKGNPPLSPTELCNGLSNSSKFQLPISPAKKPDSPVNNKSFSQQQSKYNGNCRKEGSVSPDIKIKNHINSSTSNTTCGPPPPPPPPPLPKSNAVSYNNHNQSVPNGIASRFSKECDQNNRAASTCHYNEKDDFCQAENDYEDIEELTNGGTNHYEQARKLLRSVSAPPTNLNNEQSQSGSASDEKGPPAVPDRTPTLPNKPPAGCGKPGLPFIPPHFPTPPHDALIKPSEYLRSIQNKPKPSNGAHPNGTSLSRSSSRVEEALKALGVHDNHGGLMSPVPEETNAEDEFEEINPERINGCIKMNTANQENGNYDVSNHYHQGSSNGTDENNNHTTGYSNNSNKANGGCGMIKAEELLVRKRCDPSHHFS